MTHTLLFPLFHFLLTETNVEIISLFSCCPVQPEETFAQEDATTRKEIIQIPEKINEEKKGIRREET